MRSKFDNILPFFTILSPILVYLFIRFFFPGLLVFNNLLTTLETLYAQYGIYIIFIAGVAESIFLLNMFVPGSIIILLGAVLAARGAISLQAVIIVGTTGLLLGYSFNYFVGSFGWYRLLSKKRIFKLVEAAEKRIKKQETFIIFLSGFNPNALSVVSMASGILKIDFRRFITKVTITQICWSTFWGILFYVFGIVMLKNIYFVVILAATFISVTYWLKNKFNLSLKIIPGK